MKALEEKILFNEGNGITANLHKLSSFDFNWHYHESVYELTLICEGNGQRYAGDCISAYGINDLVLIPPGLPHTWSSNQQNDSNVAIVIQFSSDIFSPLGELSKLNSFLGMTSGYSFSADEAIKVKESCFELLELEEVPRLCALLNLLDRLRLLKYNTLSSHAYSPSLDLESRRRMDKLHGFLAAHKTGFKVPELASHLHMSESTLRRFIKKNTGRSLIEYNNEIRIGHSCAQLINTKLPVIELAMDCGFENLSHFNRVFKKLKNKTPREFRNAYIEG